MLHALIMAGGSGTRLWPESRADWPKQLLNIQGDRTMIQATVDRVSGIVPPDRIVVATTERLAEKISEQVSGLPRESILCEPYPRNTAPCVGLAAIHVSRNDADATMVVMPSDHVIGPEKAFQETIRLAAALVEEQPDRLVTFGIRPTYPAESFGYIECGQPLHSEVMPRFDDPPRVFHVKRFHEKPSLKVAHRYLRAGTFRWNSGIFLWKARTILDALARYQPKMDAHLRRIAEAMGTPQFDDVLRREFAAIDKVSIDYAVMERAPEVVVIESPFDWDDVGSWRAFERLRQLDENDNVIDAVRHLEIDTTGTIARANDPNHALVLVGVRDLIDVVTPDATLVADKHDEESIREVIDQLEERGWSEYL